MPLLACRALDVEVESRCLVRGLELEVGARALHAILGPNGAGKSLTLQTLAGLRRPAAGTLTLAGRPLASWNKRALARTRAFLPQNVEDPFPATVLETVLLGRHPHIPLWQWESAEDAAIASRALAAVGLSGCEARSLGTLSGGERRRAALAAALAQSPLLYLLDEPISQLDPNHQIEALRLLRAKADEGAAVVITLHDPNLAARFADQVTMIGKAGAWRSGPVADILTAPHLSALYDTPFSEFRHAGQRLFIPD